MSGRYVSVAVATSSEERGRLPDWPEHNLFFCSSSQRGYEATTIHLDARMAPERAALALPRLGRFVSKLDGDTHKLIFLATYQIALARPNENLSS